MKKAILLLFITLFCIRNIHAQGENRPSPSDRSPVIPSFTLVAPDSSSLTRNNLPKHKKTLLMYFSPDCDHCKDQTNDMLKNMNRLKDIQILMITYQPFEEMVAFYNQHQLKKYSNIQMGRDAQFFFVPFYRIRDLPYLVLYGAKGNLIRSFEGTTPMDKIIDAFERKISKKG